MPTAPSSAELRTAVPDLAVLLRFRSATLSSSGRRRLLAALAVVGLLTVGLVAGAAWLPGTGDRPHAGALMALLPSAMVGFLLLTVVSAVASGGGREVVPRDQAVAFPVSATTEHLGALLMAPLNIAWLLQSWALLGTAAYAVGPHRLWSVEIPMIVWILVATTAAQLLGWLIEGLRRGRHGLLAFRLLLAMAGVGAVGLVVSGQLAPFLDRGPTQRLVFVVTAGPDGQWRLWLSNVAALVAAGVVVLYAGAAAAGWALGRQEREELRLESGRRRPRPMPRSAFAAMVRVDRASVWRSVPLRRGIAVLALMPGAVALAGALPWESLAVLPGLVVSGGALLFGVNAWCLDGRGALWRDSLPGDPALAYWARAVVLAEVLVAAAGVTALLAIVRAGAPTASEAASLGCVVVVVTAQVVATSMRWSVARPFAADLRSARATPAPPVVMVGYSARLACWTTLTGLLFGLLSRQPDWEVPVLVAVALLARAGHRLIAVARAWREPSVRAGVIISVLG
ncbi:hypothetical protein [Nocardioides terrisoli]|uniref:hypothetical protein n=1 Tax=Nocardioides terrisoli TaxID=3388267 RepID=UPI00287BB16A|nr:hypothetical protein [Nocardioides marmorisolisilvae]